MIDNDKLFAEMSEQAMNAQRSGDMASLSHAHKVMAYILLLEGKFRDEIKSRIIAFYLDLSGVSQRIYIDLVNIDGIKFSARRAGMNSDEISEIYYSTIRRDMTPKHAVTVKGGYRILKMCLEDKWGKVLGIVQRLKEKQRFVDENARYDKI